MPLGGDVRIAQAMIRGDALLLDVERERAEAIGDRAHAIAHTADPDAPREAAERAKDEPARRASRKR